MDLSEELDKWCLFCLVEGIIGSLLDVFIIGFLGKVFGFLDGVLEVFEDEEFWFCWLWYLVKIFLVLFEENFGKKMFVLV